MNRLIHSKLLVSILAGVTALVAAPVTAADEATAVPPAGQMCPEGSYVVGFDAGANIVCFPQPAASSRDAPQESARQAEVSESENISAPAAATAAPAAASVPAVTEAAAVAAPAGALMEVTDVEPSSVVFGKREVTITLTGTGFTADSMVRFEGVDYRPSVSGDGARLTVTLPTRDLSIGNYPITVTNGSGEQVRAKKKLAVF